MSKFRSTCEVSTLGMEENPSSLMGRTMHTLCDAFGVDSPHAIDFRAEFALHDGDSGEWYGVATELLPNMQAYIESKYPVRYIDWTHTMWADDFASDPWAGTDTMYECTFTSTVQLSATATVYLKADKVREFITDLESSGLWYLSDCI